MNRRVLTAMIAVFALATAACSTSGSQINGGASGELSATDNKSTVLVEPSTLPADGKASSKITVAVKDANGVVVDTEATIVLNANPSGGVSFSSVSKTAPGVYTASLTSTTPGAKVLSATVSIGGKATTLNQTVTVTFTAAASPSPSASAAASPSASAAAASPTPARTNTAAPTVAATTAPTVAPTVAPTPSPTVAPTPTPTAALTPAPSPVAGKLGIFGTVTGSSGAGLGNVCIAVGPPVRCATTTDGEGKYYVSLDSAPAGITWDVHFIVGGQLKLSRPAILVAGPGPTQVNATLP